MKNNKCKHCEQLIIHNVSQQRELLKFFAEKWNPEQTTYETVIDEQDIEKCIKNFNCG